MAPRTPEIPKPSTPKSSILKPKAGSPGSDSVATHPGARVDRLNGRIADFAGLVVLELSQP